MNLLRVERDTLDSYIPGLDKYLSEIPLLELEQPGQGALRKFRELGGPALLVPAEYEGKGASLLDQHVIPSYSLNSSNVLRLTPPAILDAADLDWLARALTSAAKHVSNVMPAAA